MKTIFVVEDDDSIRDMVIYALRTAGFNPLGIDSGTDLFPMLEKTVPDLILLDIMLPGEDGTSLLKKLKIAEKYRDIPVIMLTAKGTEIDRIKGLDLGADDYISKPFSIMESISRIKAVLRRSDKDKKDESVIEIGGITMFTDKRQVRVENEEILLTYKEYELLYYMMINPDIALSRDKLLEQVWGFDYNGESRTVDMHIKTLRQKLGDVGDLIKTVRNVGYKIGG